MARVPLLSLISFLVFRAVVSSNLKARQDDGSVLSPLLQDASDAVGSVLGPAFDSTVNNAMWLFGGASDLLKSTLSSPQVVPENQEDSATPVDSGSSEASSTPVPSADISLKVTTTPLPSVDEQCDANSNQVGHCVHLFREKVIQAFLATNDYINLGS